jgi:PTH1 family peptidyl-tRNA hydrolase
MVADTLAREAQTQIKREECRALVGRAEIENLRVELVKPQTFMNLSGESVSCLLRKPDRSARKLIVISDDLALPFGSIRLRAKGSAGGHNGLKSLIECLNTNEFIRLRIGIGPDHPLTNTKNFVLENFAKGEIAAVEKVLEKSAGAIRSVLADGIEKAMSLWNAGTEDQ